MLLCPDLTTRLMLCIDAVIKGISDGWSKETVAATVAGLLRTRLKEKLAEKHH